MNFNVLNFVRARLRFTPARLFAISQGVALALAAALPVPAWAGSLPTPCTGTGTCGTSTTPNLPFASSGAASYAINGATGTVSQTTPKAIVNWKDFNIGAGNTLLYQFVDGAGNAPRGASFSTLNRIWQGSKSVIEGKIRTLEGQTSNQIFINTNGFLFKGGSQVDIHTMTFSALNMLDNDFLHTNGVLNAYDEGKRAAFFWDGSASDFANSMIEIEPEAELKAQLGGAVMLFAPKIKNQGKIATDQGQVILAAGGKVYLTAPPQINDFRNIPLNSPYRGLAGLLVEVDPFQPLDKDNKPVGPALSGEITNEKDPVTGKMGEIIAERGNVTLVALAVNQLGRVSATTSVTHKGSIRLLARQGNSEELEPALGNKVLSAVETGNAVLGADSVTEVLPYTPKEAETGQTIADDQLFHPSTVQVVGKTITLEDRAKIIVPGGHVTLSAQAKGNEYQLPGDQRNASRVYLGQGSVIDTSGVKNVAASVERYFKEVDLRGTELADDPLNRNGFLRGKKVWVDLRDLPDESFANLTAYRDAIPRTVAEKLSAGGGVTVRSEGDIVQRAGSLIDVSGGTLNHSGGRGRTSSVISNGVVIDIAQATGDRVYDGILGQYTSTDAKWGVTKTINLPANYQYYAGYVEGKDAGKIAFMAHALALDGQLKGGVTIGPNQREAPPQLGQLLIGDESQKLAGNADFKTPAVTVLKTFDPLAGAFAYNTPLPQTRADEVLISADMLNRSGLGKVVIYSNDKITVEAGSGLSLPAFGELALTGSQIDIRDNLSVTSGALAFTSQLTQLNTPDRGVTVAPGVTLSVAGEWVNDVLTVPDLSLPLKSGGRNRWDGGSITLQAYDGVMLDSGSVLDASGSGYVSAGGKFSAGNGGSLSLAANKGKDEQELVSPLTLSGQLRADAPGKGGSLTLKAAALTLGQKARGELGELVLAPEFFTAKGFASYTLEGRDSVVVSGDSTIAPTVATRFVDASYIGRATGRDIRQFSSLSQKLPHERQGASLTLAATSKSGFSQNGSAGWLTVEQGAQIQVEPKGAIALSATQKQLAVHGTLTAPGGKISLTMNGDPSSPNDSGYDAAQAIWIGQAAQLSVAGAYVQTPTSNGLRKGVVLDGGTIDINAKKGYVVAEKGALLDVSGAATVLDLPVQGNPYIKATNVASNAGTINIKAREGALLDATIKGQSAGARGGTLKLTLDRENIYPSIGRYPGTAQNDQSQQWKIALTQSQDSVPIGLKAGDRIEDHAPGRMKFAADRALQGGFEQLAFNAEHAVAFQGDVALKTASGLRSLTVNAPVIESDGGQVKLDAAYVNMGNLSVYASRQKPQSAQVGNGDLTVTAGHVDLTGHFALSGFKKATIQSDNDIRLAGVVKDINPLRPEGSLIAASEVVMKARQIYASTLSAYTVSAPGQLIQIARHGTPASVLSAGSDIRFEAAAIKLEGLNTGEPGGAIKAPFGSVTLAADDIVLGEGSLVSVSGEQQIIPFGRTDLTGRDYLYDIGEVNKAIGTPPEKRIALDGKNVEFKQGATLDVSGGGDLLAYEWIKGIGGTHDVLSPGVSPNTYAVLPGVTGTVAPSDAQTLAEMALADVSAPLAGAAVYLSGAPGLDARYYTLLPARFGILPGARLVTLADAKYQDMLPNQAEALALGGRIVAGHFAALNRDGGYTQTGRTQGFIVEPNSVAKARSEYLLTKASDYFKGKGVFQLPGDAGRVVFNAQDSLNLIGQLVAKREAGYRGAEVDIAAPKLAVMSPGGAPLTAAEKSEKYVELDADALNALGAESLLLGGTRSVRPDGDGVDIQVVSEKMIVANAETATEKHALKGPEIILAATKEVLVKTGSAIQGEGASTARTDKLNITNANGDGALLRVASGPQVAVQRNAASGAAGNLILETGSKVGATGSLNFDATKNTELDGNIALGAGAGLALAAGSISLGDVAGVKDGLKYDDGAFGALLKTTDDLRLRSYKTIDFYGPLDMTALLDGKAAPNLRLEAQGLVGHKNSLNADPNVILAGNQVYLSNSTGKEITPTVGTGSFEIQANEIRTGQGNFAISGFAQTKLTANQQIIADGVGSIVSAAPLTLTARRVTATAASQYAFKSSGDLTLYAPQAGKANALLQSVPGTELAFEGGKVTLGSLIDLPGGKLSVKATSGDIILTKDGELRAAGNEEWIFDAPVGQPGGTIDLNASNQVNLATGSVVDVSAKGADAGTLRIAADSILVDGDLKGSSTAGSGPDKTTGNQGRFELDVGALADLGPLAAKLKTGNFTDSVRIRVQKGNTALSQGATLKARDIQISADDAAGVDAAGNKLGNLTIGGTLDASSARGGSIYLAAQQDVILDYDAAAQQGANLIATASVGEHAGKIEIASADGNLNMKSGSKIDMTGNARLGQLWLRLQDAKIASSHFDSTVTGAELKDANGNVVASNKFIEAVKVHDFSQAGVRRITSSDIAMIQAATKAPAPVAGYRVVPGVEIRNKLGSLELAADWNFSKDAAGIHKWRYNGEAGALTLRARDDVVIAKSLTDGFKLTQTGVANKITVPVAQWIFDDPTPNSWSYRIVAGSDFDRAAPLAVNQSKTGNVVITPYQAFVKDAQGNIKLDASGNPIPDTATNANTDTVVRTGTGFIDIAAGDSVDIRKMTVKEKPSANLSAVDKTIVAAVYTAGLSGPTLSGFTLPPTPPVILLNRNGISSQFPKYPTSGGNIRLQAQGNISGNWVEVTPSVANNSLSEPIINQWLYRYYQTSQVNPQTSWWPRFDKFRQGVATLGGGDISVEAGGNINSLFLSAPTNARLGGDKTKPADINNLVMQGGGDIVVRAGGDVKDGLVFIAKGEGHVTAGGALESRVALQDGHVQLTAVGDVTILDAFNPTAYKQSSNNSDSGNNGVALVFHSYGDTDTGIRALSRAGDAVLKSKYASDKGVAYPARLAALAPQGSVRVDSRIVLFPSALGDLAFLAGKDVTFNQNVIMSDFSLTATTVPGISKPIPSMSDFNDLGAFGFPQNHDPALLHKGDAQVARVYAREGDIASEIDSEALVLAKAGSVQAGHDIKNLWVRFQNLSDTDTSQVSAGHDISFKPFIDKVTGKNKQMNHKLEASGPGQLEVIAGHDIDLGPSGGIVSVGDFYNPYLPDQGASIAVIAGMGRSADGGARQPDYAAFKQKFIDPTATKDPLNPYEKNKALAAFEAALKAQARKEIRAALKYEAELAGKPLDDAALNQLLDTTQQAQVAQRANDLLAAFNAQPLAAQARRVFFSELKEASKEWTEKGDASRGTQAAQVLFPETINGQPANYAGDINLFFSQIKTERGGDIEMLAPGGLINVGLASPGENTKTPSELGIVSARGGDVRAYVRDDIQVNQSRIFTLGGSDIVLWAELGDIDAGKGAKTARSAPPPVLVVKDGKVTFDITGSVSGSGIGALETRKDAPIGDVYLIAPNGEVNAGDAGIRSAGNLLIAAQRVVGADNIQVGGVATGVPVESASLGGALAGVSGIGDASKATDEQTKALSNAAGDGDKAMKEARDALANFRPSFITVEVMGFGSSGESSGLAQ
ncbi:MAG: filamentous hemagglutinin family protein [Burkholderiales bacterium]|nr:filamentous hemagglutinin family protein [Burkholderiales bacterium]